MYSCHPIFLLTPSVSLSIFQYPPLRSSLLRCVLSLLMKTTVFQSSSSPSTARMVYQRLWLQQPPCYKVRHGGTSQKLPIMVNHLLVCPGQHHWVQCFISTLKRHKMTQDSEQNKVAVLFNIHVFWLDRSLSWYLSALAVVKSRALLSV